MNNLEEFCKKHTRRVKKRINSKKYYDLKKLKNKNYYLEKFCKKHIKKIIYRKKISEYNDLITCSLCGLKIKKGFFKKESDYVKEFEKKCYVCRNRPKKQVLFFTNTN